MTQKSNHFSKYFVTKDTNELIRILSSDDHTYEAKLAARWELEKRDEYEKLDDELKIEQKVIFDDDRYDQFTRSIKTKWSFAFNPKFIESFKTDINASLIHALAIKAFKHLEWDIIFEDVNEVEAKRKNSFDKWTEKISVKIAMTGEVIVKSESLSNVMLDFGSNSKRVKLFIHVFREVESEITEEQILALGKEIKRKTLWEDYVIPENLPNPDLGRNPEPAFLILASIIASVALGGLFAITSKYIYIILLFESGIGIALAYILYQGIKMGNYTHFILIRSFMGLSVVAIIVLNHYFQFVMIKNEYNANDLTFFQFITYRLEAGFTFRDMNTGWIGWLIVIGIQLVFIYYISLIRLAAYINNFLISRVPEEVINFTVYHFVKGKSETEVRNELSLKGWSDQRAQQMVMEAISGIKGEIELQRAT